MFRPRIIPVLLLKNRGLVKSVKFKNYRYVGDPINAVRIFNDLKADELVFLDITATKEKKLISLDFVQNVGEEAQMPFTAGGGISSLEDIRSVIRAGAEKVIINSYAVRNPGFIRQAADTFGSSTIVVCIDVKKNLFGKQFIYIESGRKPARYHPVEFAQLMQENGAGEIIVQSIDYDGTMNGYDINLIRSVADAVTIPVIALGGAGKLEHLQLAYFEGHAHGLAAGSIFVFQGNQRGVLINYPDKSVIKSTFSI